MSIVWESSWPFAWEVDACLGVLRVAVVVSVEGLPLAASDGDDREHAMKMAPVSILSVEWALAEIFIGGT